MLENKYPPDWEKRRAKVFERDEYECQGCGENVEHIDNDSLHAHHITPISEGGGHSLTNLVTLCGDCHTLAHSKGDGPKYFPIHVNDCPACGEEYIHTNAYKGSFCSKLCWAKHKREKFLNQMEHEATICANCFSKIDKDYGHCTNCGNLDPNNPSGGESDPDIDAERLVLMSILYMNQD